LLRRGVMLLHGRSPFDRTSSAFLIGSLSHPVGAPAFSSYLATMFSKTCRHSVPSFGSNWFQFQPADKCLERRSARRSITRCSSLLSGSALILFQCDHSLKPFSPQRVWCGVPGPAKKEISEQSWPRKQSKPKFCGNQVKAGNHAKQRSEPWF
jgi:hypothetical protein